MKIKRPFALKTDKISSEDLRESAVAYRKAENIAPEIAKALVKYGKKARECKQLLKEADKILSECGQDAQNAKYLEIYQKFDKKGDELDEYYIENIGKKINEIFEK